MSGHSKTHWELIEENTALRKRVRELESVKSEQSPALLAALIDSISDIILCKDMNGVYLACNDEFARHVGRDKSEIVGRYLLLGISDTGCRMSPDIVERIFDPYCTTKEKAREAEIRCVLKNPVGLSEDLRIAAEHKEDIRLLITDAIIPGMNGRELADQLSASHPDIKLLFMSGYTAGVIAHHGVLDFTVKIPPSPRPSPPKGWRGGACFHAVG